MNDNLRIKALVLIDTLEHDAEEYGEFRLAAFREESADLLRMAITQSAALTGETETALLLFIGWLRAHHMIEVTWNDDQYTYVLKNGMAVGDFVENFLKGEQG